MLASARRADRFVVSFLFTFITESSRSALCTKVHCLFKKKKKKSKGAPSVTSSQLDALQGEAVRFALRHPKLFCRKFHFFFLFNFFLSRLLLFVEPCDRHAQVQPRDPSVYEPDCAEKWQTVSGTKRFYWNW